MDKTFEMSGSLSQMWYAGVSDSIIDKYITEHKKMAESQSFNLTETQIRDDYSFIDNSRSDEEAFPIIMMGYNGGYVNDVDELTDQINEILKTYEQQEEYLVVGVYPSGWTSSGTHTSKEYDNAMEDAFGEHYLSASSEVDADMFSSEGRSSLADAVFEKLEDMYPEWIKG